MSINVVVDLTEAQDSYLAASARIRGVSRTQLIRSILSHVLDDQLILSIVDDGDAPSAKTAPKPRRPGPGRPRRDEVPPRDTVFSGLSRSVPQRRATRFNPSHGFTRQQPKTRADLEAELRDAVLNTGGELVK